MVLLFSCLALLEYETSLLYEAIVEKVQDPRIKLLLINILETKKHKEVFEQISRAYGQVYPPAIVDCKRELGRVFKEPVEFGRTLRENFQKGMSLLEVMEKLIDYENAVGEEYLTLIHSRLKLLDEKDVTISKILEYTAAHEEALKLAVRIASENNRDLA